MKEKERNKMFFVGNYENPLVIGKKGEIMDLIDEEYYSLFDAFRWYRAELLDVNFKTAPALLSYAIRGFNEVTNG